jgi:DNA-binding NtrC family response regulator
MMEPKGSLLIVDDDDDVRMVLEEILSPVALKVQTACNGRQAFDMILQDNYDCVVSDISMPEMTGLDLLREVRKLSVAIPFVMVSAFGDQENLRQALKLGATDFVDKPFDSKHLKSVVQKGLEYGSLLYEIDIKIEDLFKKSKLPPEELLRFKEMQKQLLKMKAESSIYLKAG